MAFFGRFLAMDDGLRSCNAVLTCRQCARVRLERGCVGWCGLDGLG